MLETNNISLYKDYIENENYRLTLYRLEFLRRQDESVIFSFDGNLVDATGSVTNSLNDGVRKTCSLSLTNVYNKYSDFFDKLSIGSKFKLYMGYMTEEGAIFFSYGVYVMDNPIIMSNIGDKTITINGSDKWSLLNGTNGGILQSTYIASAGSNIYNLLDSILNLEIVQDPKKLSIYGKTVLNGDYLFSPPFLEDAEIPYEIIKDAGSSVADLILEIVFSVNAYCFYNDDGRLIVKEFEYDATKCSIHHFITGADRYEDNDINYISSQKTYDYINIYNAVAVIADNTQNSDVPIVAYAYNNDDSDPNNIESLGYIKYKVITEYTNGISSYELALERARFELKKAAAQQSVITLTCLPQYHFKVNNVVTVTDKYINSDSERFLITSINTVIGAEGATMTLELLKSSAYL